MIISNSFAQKETIKTVPKLLPNEAFNKMVIQDITYAILGESSPVSGVKIDITKPEGSISGIIRPRKDGAVFINLELKGGVSNSRFSIFKGQNNFNTNFEVKPSIHIIPKWNSAKYRKYNEPILTAKNDLIELNTGKIKDSCLVATIIYNRHLKKFPDLIENQPIPQSPSIRQTSILKNFVKKILKDDSLQFNGLTFNDILDLIPEADDTRMSDTYIDDVVELHKKYSKKEEEIKSEEISKQIKNVSEAWTKKNYFWLSISPFGRTEKINEYFTKDNEKDSHYFKSDYPFFYGIDIKFNHYMLWTEKVVFYYNIGFGLSHSNNLSTLKSFNYETNSPLFSYGNKVTTKTETGTAYNHTEIKSGSLTQILGELYLLPIKSMFPGLYISSSINSSNLYNLSNVVGRENDKTLIPMEGGLVFNINSREKGKEKNLLSISTYLRFEDLTDKKRESKTTGDIETKSDFLKRNRSIGIKVGIPITLPKKSDD